MIENQRSRRSRKLALALGTLLIGTLYLDAVQYPHYRNSTLIEGNNPPAPIRLPTSLQLGRSQISFEHYNLPLAPTGLTLYVDDCVEEILIDGRRPSMKALPPCGTPSTFTVPLPRLSYGLHTVRINARNLNGPGRIEVLPSASIGTSFCARILLIFSIIVSAAHITQRAARAPRWALRAIPLCVGMLSLELLSRWVFSTPSISSRMFDGGSASLRIKWILKNPSRPQLGYVMDAYDPILGWRLRPSLDGKPPSPPSITSTPDGTRSLSTSYRPVDSLAPHIMMFGDSFTFGEEVADEESYPALLAASAPDLRVTNSGVHGYGHDQMLLYLKEVIGKHKPTIVTLGFMRWDIGRNVMTFRDYAKPRFVVDGGAPSGLELRNVPVPSPEELSRLYFTAPRSAFLLSLLSERITRLWNSLTRGDDQYLLTSEILTEFARVARDNGAIPIFVYLPDRQELKDARSSALPLFSAICQKADILCEDTTPRFIARSDREKLFKPGGHYSKEGNAIIANSILAVVRSRPELLSREGARGSPHQHSGDTSSAPAPSQNPESKRSAERKNSN